MAKHDFGIIDCFEEDRWHSENVITKANRREPEIELLIGKISGAINENKYLIRYIGQQVLETGLNPCKRGGACCLFW